VLYPKINKSVNQKLKSFPRLVRQLLFNRGINSKKEAEGFFEDSKHKFYDPYKIYQIGKAAKIISDFIKDKKKIFIHGDFDVDGICATSILWDFLYRHLKANATPYVPSRFDEGYGMTDKSISSIKKQGGEVIITVDCGIKDDKLIEKWKNRGIEFIVTDHHELKKEKGKIILPEKAEAVVHPDHPKGRYPFKDLSGAAVVWKLVSVLQEMMQADIDISNYLDLVSLSAVCDVMPLVDENRSLLKAGLEKIRTTKRVGLKRLISDAGLEICDIDTYHIGFIIGPRLNAAGRLDHAVDAIRLLVTNSPSSAGKISEKLNSLNFKRQKLQEDIYEQAVLQIEERGIEHRLYFVWGEDWPEGVIGIVAGKLCEKYHRPVLIATRCKTKFKGSARSIDRFDVIDAINRQADLLDRFGGHPQAAGFTVKAENIEQFRDNLLEIADRDLSNEDIEGEETADCIITLSDIDWDLASQIEKFAPFGYGNARPKFILKSVRVASFSLVGSDQKHVKFDVLEPDTGEYFSCIGFGLADKIKLFRKKESLDLLFTIEVNEWNGSKKIQLNIKDIH